MGVAYEWGVGFSTLYLRALIYAISNPKHVRSWEGGCHITCLQLALLNMREAKT